MIGHSASTRCRLCYLKLKAKALVIQKDLWDKQEADKTREDSVSSCLFISENISSFWWTPNAPEYSKGVLGACIIGVNVWVVHGDHGSRSWPKPRSSKARGTALLFVTNEVPWESKTGLCENEEAFRHGSSSVEKTLPMLAFLITWFMLDVVHFMSVSFLGVFHMSVGVNQKNGRFQVAFLSFKLHKHLLVVFNQRVNCIFDMKTLRCCGFLSFQRTLARSCCSNGVPRRSTIPAKRSWRGGHCRLPQLYARFLTSNSLQFNFKSFPN